MCDTGNLIDLTGWDEPQKEETILEEPEASMVVESNSFKGPYDPFDSVEKEACIKGINLSTLQKETEVAKATENPYPDLENESPPVCMQSDVVLGEGVRPPNRPTNNSFQKQLLKLNASRSVINTPPHHGSKSRGASGGDSQFEKTILAENLQMIAAESPLKLIEDEPPADSNYRSSANFEEDMKMLRIPILDAMTAKEEEPKTPEEGHKADFQTPDNQPQFGHQSNTRKNVGHLLQELKTLVHDKVDITKRYHFDSVIESLDAALFGSTSIPTGDVNHATPVTTLPHAYTRQGTFDLELKDKRTTSVDEQTPPGTKMQEFPDAMVCSSATFDGDSRPELYDKDFHPMSAPPVPAPAPAAAVPLKRESFMTELVDESLALQINELLERHNRSHNEHHGADPRTVILLVNPSNGGQFQTSCFVQPPAADQQTAAKAIVANDDEGSMRRRSSSLSIHDKSKLLPERKANQLIENIQNVPPKEPRNMSSAGGPPPFRQRRNSFSIVNPPVKGAEAHNRRTILGSRMKTPSINESMTKCNGTAKASIPIKRVIPIVKPVNMAPNEGTYLNPVHPPETPMPVKPKAGQKIFCTSTPLPQMRSMQRRSLKPVSVNAVVNASYSTPNIRRPSFSKKPGSG